MAHDAAQAAAAPAARTVDLSRAEYLGSVDREMQQRAGLRYMAVRESIHPEGEAWKSAFDNNVAASDFVSGVIRDFGFRTVGSESMSASQAGAYNAAKAAMCEFASSSPDWKRGTDGFLYQPRENGVAVMRPVEDRKTGRFGYGIEFREGAAMDAWGTRLVEPGEVVSRTGQMDIGDAVSEFEAGLDSPAPFRF